MSDFGFDVGATESSTSFDPLPPGWYVMTITKADMIESQNAAVGGQMLKIEFEIDEQMHPDFRGRKVWANFCHHHEKQQTRDIARSQIAAICRAVGQGRASDATQILGGTLQVKLKVRPAEGNYDARNDCSGYRALSEDGDKGTATTAAPATATSAAAPAPAPAARTSQPWKR